MKKQKYSICVFEKYTGDIVKVIEHRFSDYVQMCDDVREMTAKNKDMDIVSEGPEYIAFMEGHV